MTEINKNKISMQEALKYQDALSKYLRGTATTIDLIVIATNDYEKSGIVLDIYAKPTGYPKDRNMI